MTRMPLLAAVTPQNTLNTYWPAEAKFFKLNDASKPIGHIDSATREQRPNTTMLKKTRSDFSSFFPA